MKSKRLVLCLCVVFWGSLLSWAQDTSKQEARRAKLEKEIAIIDNQLSELASKSSGAMTTLQLVRTKIAKQKELLNESDREIRRINSQISEQQKKIDEMQASFDKLSSAYEKLVKNAYKNRDVKVWFLYVLTSDNITQAFNRIGYFRSLASTLNQQATLIKEKKAELEKEKEQLVELKTKAESLRRSRAVEVKSLQKEESKSNSLVKQLNGQKRKYQQELNKKRKEVDALNREITRLIREATNPSSKSKTSKKTEIDMALDAEFANNKGKLPWPVDGPVVDKFGQRDHPVYKGVKLPFNNGITIAVAPSTSVRAVFDGVVKQIVVMPGYNKCVLVQHGNYFSFYCKMGAVDVKAGDKVKIGQVLGTVDTISGETKLHFQIWKGTSPQNPENWLK